MWLVVCVGFQEAKWMIKRNSGRMPAEGYEDTMCMDLKECVWNVALACLWIKFCRPWAALVGSLLPSLNMQWSYGRLQGLIGTNKRRHVQHLLDSCPSR